MQKYLSKQLLQLLHSTRARTIQQSRQVRIYEHYQRIAVIIKMMFILSIDVMVLVQVRIVLHKVAFIVPVATAQRYKK